MTSKQFIYSSLGIVGTGLGLYFAKKHIYDNFRPLTECENLVKQGAYSSCFLGNIIFMGYMKNTGYNLSFLPDDSSSMNTLAQASKDAGCDVTHTGMLEFGVGMLGVYASAFVGYKLF